MSKSPGWGLLKVLDMVDCSRELRRVRADRDLERFELSNGFCDTVL